MAARRPPYLLRLKVSNFRSLRDVEVHLRSLNVLVGPNGAGKSNLLDVVGFLGDSVREDLEPALARRGGFERVLFRGEGRIIRRIVIDVEAAVTKNSSQRATDNYSLTISQGRMRRANREPDTFLVREESFLFKRTAGPGRRISIKGSDITFRTGETEQRTGSLRQGSLGLSTLPKLSPEEGGEQVEELANLFAGFRVFDVDVQAARLPSTTIRTTRLHNDASNLAAFLLYMAEAHGEVFEALVDDARVFIPGLAGLAFVTAGGAKEATYLTIIERGLRGTTTLSEASYGSIRALSLLALLHDPSPPRLTCIEEIDHGLHPYVLDRLVELLREASSRTQFLIATHSPALVNRLRSEELIVCERGDDAASRIPAIDPAVVRRMEEELNGEVGLGELWFTGALGGVP